MGNKKYELTEETKAFDGVTLHRIKALRSFGTVKKGDLGGYIEKEDNLSHNGDAWVGDNAQVSGDAWVGGNARVSGDARVGGNARVCDNARVGGYARVSDNARVGCNEDYLCFKGLGSVCRNTTFFKCSDGEIKVACGCFLGTLTEFEQKVKETHGESKHAKEYLACLEVVKIHFEIGGKESPLPVEYEGYVYDDNGEIIYDYDKAYCPNCRNEYEVDYDYHDNYCRKCGQKLDWRTQSETD